MLRALRRSPRAFASFAALSLALCGSKPAYASTFIFSTFNGDGIPLEKLAIYESSDALDFKLRSDTGFSGPSGALRDPSIMKYKDGKYYVAYTDPIGAGCCGKEDHFSIASSTDLVHWANLTQVLGGVPGVAHVWAPEWFVDGSTIDLIVNMDTQNTDSDFKPYVFTAQGDSLTSWSGPVPLGIGPNYIDTFVMKRESTYHLFAKQETTRYVEHATASKLTGPWTFVGRGDFAGWGGGMEGPAVVQLDNGQFRIFMDAQGSAGFVYADSADLFTWSKAKSLPVLASTARHGTIIRDSVVGEGGMGGGMGGGGMAGSAGQGPAAAGTTGSPDAGGTMGGDGGAAFAGTGAIAGDPGLLAAGGAVAVGGMSGAVGVAASGGFGNGGDPSASAGTNARAPLGAAQDPAGCGCSLSRSPSALGALWLLSLWGALGVRGRRRRASAI